MNILGKDTYAIVNPQPTEAWEKNFAFLHDFDARLAMNYGAKAQTNNGFRRAVNGLFDSEEVGANVFDAFYAPGRESRIGMKKGTCAYSRCVVNGQTMTYVVNVDGVNHTATKQLPF